VTKPLILALVGATGEVGRATLEAIEALDLPVGEVRPFGSPRSSGHEVEVQGELRKVVPLSAGAFRGCDAALFCAPPEVSLAWAPRAWAEGCPAVDVSSAFRGEPDVPLVVPEVNPGALEGFRARGIVACPGPLATALALLLAPLRAARPSRVVVTALVPASGEGRAGVAELEKQARDLLGLREPEPASRFPHRLAFNAVPQAGAAGPDGSFEAEAAAGRELRRVLGLDLAVHLTVVRVPVFYGDLLTVFLETGEPLDAAVARERLRSAPGVKVIDDPAQGVYPMPMLASQEDAVLAGRIRSAGPRTLELVAVLEATRRGAATTALGIVRLLAGRGEGRPGPSGG
jgi:aspartate-semialdehyde dehydrogenase